jgi:hypothetical protein
VTSLQAWTLGVPATIAVVGLLATYWFNLRLARRKDRLEWVNEQLKDLYGPLLALVSAADSAWRTFRDQYRPQGGYWSQDRPPTDEEAQAWRRWMTNVFMPLDRQMRDLIVSKAHLFDETEIPDCLLLVCAHVSAYEPILARWAEGDYVEHKPRLQFPKGEALDYATKSFKKLKSRQQELIRHR